MTTLKNWNASATSTAQQVVAPASVTELQRIVKDRSAYPCPVRAAGHRHSVNACFAADRGSQHGTQVLMRHFDHVSVDAESTPPTITVGAGVTLLQIREALRPHGLELDLMPEIGNATAGSVACAGTKDSWIFPGPPAATGWGPGGAGRAQICSLVRGLGLVDAQGNDVRVTDPARLHVLRSSYGLMGIIHEVTFEVRKARILRSEYEWFRVAPYDVPSLDTVFAHAHGVLAFLQPYSGRLLVERRTPVPDSVEIGPLDELRRSARDYMWEWGASEATTFADALAHFLRRPLAPDTLAPLLSPLVPRVPVTGSLTTDAVFQNLLATLAQAERPGPGVPLSDWLLTMFDASVKPLFQAIDHFHGYRGDSMIDFQAERPSYFDFTFWAFPVSRWPALVGEYIAFCRQWEASFRSRLFTEIYFIAQDRDSLLSFSPDEPVFTLDMVDAYARGDDARRGAWHAMSEEYNRWAAARGGRPVLNQTKQIDRTPEVVQAPHALGNVWPTFQASVAQADPQGRFRNGFFDALL